MATKGAVVITGASTGIGEATALRLATSGFTVFAGVRKDADADRLTTASLPALRPVKIDVADSASIRTALAEVTEAVGDEGLVGLINNAGISGGGPLEFTTLDEIRQMFEVNVFGLIETTQAFLPLVRRAKGRIICTGSVSGEMAVPFVAPYSMTKVAVLALCHALRMELRPWGIKVICVEPGSIATPIWEKGLSDFDARVDQLPEEAHRLYGALIPKLKAMTERTAKAGIPPARVADVMYDALTARRPRSRYIVGLDARGQAILGRMPDRVRDAALSRVIGIDAE